MIKVTKIVCTLAVLALCTLLVRYFTVKPPLEGDWQDQLATQAHAEFNGNSVTVQNVRNFRYEDHETVMHPAYYDRTYNLDQLTKVWFVAEPFNQMPQAGHTFLSFEFENGDYLSITIEARKTKDQSYSVFKGLLRTYPLMYIPADERDTVLVRANQRKDNVFIYPVATTKEKARLLLTSMLNRMNILAERPEWYNSITANCTSSIVEHINEISPGRISALSWQLLLTAHADELALRKGLLDTTLSIDEARATFQINKQSEQYGDRDGYSRAIRTLTP